MKKFVLFTFLFILMSTAVLAANPLEIVGDGISNLFEGEVSYTPPGLNDPVNTTVAGFLLAWGLVFSIFYALVSWSGLGNRIPFLGEATNRVKMSIALFFSLSIVYFSPFSEWIADLILGFVFVLFFIIFFLILLFGYIGYTFIHGSFRDSNSKLRESLNESDKRNDEVAKEVKERHATNLAHEATVAATVKQAETDLYNTNGTLPENVKKLYLGRIKALKLIMSDYKNSFKKSKARKTLGSSYSRSIEDFLKALGDLISTIPEHEMLPYLNSHEGKQLINFIRYHLRDDFKRDIDTAGIFPLALYHRSVTEWRKNPDYVRDHGSDMDRIEAYVQDIRLKLNQEIGRFDLELGHIIVNANPADYAREVADGFLRFRQFLEAEISELSAVSKLFRKINNVAKKDAKDAAKGARELDSIIRYLSADPRRELSVEGMKISGRGTSTQKCEIFVDHASPVYSATSSTHAVELKADWGYDVLHDLLTLLKTSPHSSDVWDLLNHHGVL